jgi:hypothetical protein
MDDFEGFDFNEKKPETNNLPTLEDFDGMDFAEAAPVEVAPVPAAEAPSTEFAPPHSTTDEVIRQNAAAQQAYEGSPDVPEDENYTAADGFVDVGGTELMPAVEPEPVTLEDFEETDFDVSGKDAGNYIVNDALALPRAISAGSRLAVGSTIAGVSREIALAGKPYGAVVMGPDGAPSTVSRAPLGIQDHADWEAKIRKDYPTAVFTSENDTDFMDKRLSAGEVEESWFNNVAFDTARAERIAAGLEKMNRSQAVAEDDNFFQSAASGTAKDAEEWLDNIATEISENREGTSGFGDFLQDVGVSAGVSATAMIPSMTSGNAMPGLAMMKMVTTYMGEDEAIEAGADRAQAERYGKTQGDIEIFTEMLPMGWLFGRGADALAKPIAKQIGEFLVREVPTEMLATVGQNTSQMLQLNPDMTQEEFWTKMKEDVIHTAAITPFAGSLQVGAANLAKKAVEPTFKKIAGKIVSEPPSTAFRDRLQELGALEHDQEVLSNLGKMIEDEVRIASDNGLGWDMQEEINNVAGPFSSIQKKRFGTDDSSDEFSVEAQPHKEGRQNKANEIKAKQKVRMRNGVEGTPDNIGMQPGETAVAFTNPIRANKRRLELENIKMGGYVTPQTKLDSMEAEAVEMDKMVEQAHEMLESLVTTFLPGTKMILAINAETNETTSGYAITKAENGTSGSMMALGDVSLMSINPYMFAGSKATQGIKDSAKLPQTLTHELGHAMIAHWLNNGATEFPGLANHIKEAYVLALEDGQANFKTFGQSMFAPHRYNHFVDNNQANPEGSAKDEAPSYSAYAMSLEEFTAESMVKFALGKQQPRTESEKVMKDAGKQLKALWEDLDTNFPGSETFAEFAENAMKVDQLHNIRKERETLRQKQEIAKLEIEEYAPQNMSGPKLEKLIQDAMEANTFRSDGWNDGNDGGNGNGGFTGWMNTEMKDFSKNVNDEVTRHNWFMGQTASMLEMVKMNKHIPGAVAYGEASIGFWNTKMQWTAQASEVLTNWRRHVGGFRTVGKHSEAFDEFLIAADTMSEEKQRLLTPQEMLEIAEKNNLTEDDIAMAQQIWSMYQSALTEMEDVLISRLQQVDANKDPNMKDALDVGLEISRIKRDFTSMRNRNYMPHSRFGKYSVTVKALEEVVLDGRTYKKGTTISYGTAETHRQRLALLRDMKKVYGGSRFSVQQRTAKDDTVMMMQGLPPEMIAHLRQRLNLDETQSKQLDEALIEMQPGQGIRKHFLKRKGVAGYENDMMRVYADYFSRFANHIARTKHEFEFDAALTQIEVSATPLRNDVEPSGLVNPRTTEEKRIDLYNYFNRHREYLMNPGNEFSEVRSVGFLWYLGYVPKSAVVNLTQVPMVVYPYLQSRFGDISTTVTMGQAMNDAFAHWTGKFDPRKNKHPVKAEELEMWQELIDRGILDESMVTELAALANDQTMMNIKNDGTLMSGVRLAARGGAYMFQTAEKMNRYYTSLSAYRLAVKSGKTHKDASQFAWETVKDTQFEYARFNRPEMMRGAKSVPFLFMQYLTNMMYFVANDPGRWRYVLAMLVVGGYTALPGAENIMHIINPIFTKFKARAGWADPKKSVKEYISELVNSLEERVEWLPDNFNQVVEKGLAGNLWGYDIQGSMSMGNITPIDTSVFEREMPMQDKIGKLLLSATGAPGEALFNMMVAAGTEEPWSYRHVEKAGPTQAKNMMKAFRRHQTQQETDNSGNVIMEFDQDNPYEWTSAIMEGMGFSRHDIKHEKEIDFIIRDSTAYYSNRSKFLRDSFFKMRQKEDNGQEVGQDDWDAFDKKLEAYNGGVKNLGPKLVLTYGDLVESWKTRKSSERNQQIFGHREKKFRGLADGIDTNLR